jgi:dynein heavy chain
MYECIEIKIKEMNLQSTDYFVTKIIQLYEMILVRHGLMVVGLPFSGKTSAIKVLAGALTLLK